MIDHITYEVGPWVLEDPELASFMTHLGMVEIDNPDLRDTMEKGYNVRWFAKSRKTALPGAPDEPQRPVIHLVAGRPVAIGLGHFAVRVGAEGYKRCRGSKWCVRDSGSGRVWLQFNYIRVEVRP